MTSTAGHDGDREPGVGERVRFCLECGDVLPFDAVRCPACGTREPGAPSDSGPEQGCPACGARQSAGLLFCGSCGVDVGLAAGAPALVPRAARSVPPERAGTAIATLSVLLVVLAPLLVAFVVAELLLAGRTG